MEKEKKIININFRCTETFKQKVQEEAEKQKVNLSRFIERMFYNYLEEQEECEELAVKIKEMWGKSYKGEVAGTATDGIMATAITTDEAVTTTETMTLATDEVTTITKEEEKI